MSEGAVEKALVVLEALAEHSRITELARVTGLPKSTVHRLLRTLIEQGFAVATGESDYRIGPKVLVLAGNVLQPADSVERARPVLTRLQASTGCAVHFAMLLGEELVYVDKVESGKPYRMTSRIGGTLPLHSTAIGKSVLSTRDTSTVDTTRWTQYTITDPDRLRAQLARVRSCGFAVDDQENELGVRCVGAAVRNHNGMVIGGISVSTLALEHTVAELIALGPHVVRAANDISAALGHQR
ncbi:IclR family transcriptional regulator [Kutzneria albida]|uniref:IclR family transcription regulator n=1 Tax=Kutzneria albida DSM 43870 TaxID=1449976 RepID=W5VZ43_9PSEU|nr:IclR family transcriptional regulator [Kutzneria albida]AHH93715.1 IclR family transcription regulator [Kutzneria albida DSM 43870]